MDDEPPSDLDDDDLYSMPPSKQSTTTTTLKTTTNQVASTSNNNFNSFNSSNSRQIIEDVPMDIEFGMEEEEEVLIRPGVKEGKRRLVLEMEDGFGEEEGDNDVLNYQVRGE